jgi:hypothetical protein
MHDALDSNACSHVMRTILNFPKRNSGGSNMSSKNVTPPSKVLVVEHLDSKIK